MELGEAKEFIKNSWLFNTANENIRLKEAISTILQELDRLQRENEELKEENNKLKLWTNDLQTQLIWQGND